MHMRTHTMHAHTYTCTHTMQAHACTHTHAHIHTTHVHACTHTYNARTCNTHTHTHTHIHNARMHTQRMHMHTCTLCLEATAHCITLHYITCMHTCTHAIQVIVPCLSTPTTYLLKWLYFYDNPDSQTLVVRWGVEGRKSILDTGGEMVWIIFNLACSCCHLLSHAIHSCIKIQLYIIVVSICSLKDIPIPPCIGGIEDRRLQANKEVQWGSMWEPWRTSGTMFTIMSLVFLIRTHEAPSHLATQLASCHVSNRYSTASMTFDTQNYAPVICVTSPAQKLATWQKWFSLRRAAVRVAETFVFCSFTQAYAYIQVRIA